MRIGIDIGGNHIAMAVVENENIIDKKEYVYSEEFKSKIASNIEILLKNVISEFINKYEIEKIGISIAGRLKDNILYFSPNLKGLVGIDFVKMLSNFSIPVTVNKDSFCAGKAEKVYGCLKEFNNTSVFLIVGTGIGGIGYYGNTLYRAGYGHMIIQKDGRQCKCGKKGCFETYGSITALKNEVKKYLNITNMTGKDLHDYLILHQYDKDVQIILDNYIKDFCIGLSNIIDIVLPEAIGFGGSFSYYEELFLNRIKNTLSNEKLLADPNSIPNLTMGRFKNDAGIIGATLF